MVSGFPLLQPVIVKETSIDMSEWQHTNNIKRIIPGKPPAPEELGNAGWTVLHTAAAAFPNKPNQEQQDAMRQFIVSWSKVYACSHCAYHMRTVLAKKPPVVTSKRDTSQYVCELHNDVNYMLGKEVFDCSPDAVLKRWHPTYPDMEDAPTIEEQIAEQRQRDSNQSQQKNNSSSVGGSDISAPSTSRWRWGTSGGNATNSAPATSTNSAKVADDETNVDAVLARLKGCQVYCPEKK